MAKMAKCGFCGNEAYVYEENEYKEVMEIITCINDNEDGCEWPIHMDTLDIIHLRMRIENGETKFDLPIYKNVVDYDKKMASRKATDYNNCARSRGSLDRLDKDRCLLKTYTYGLPVFACYWVHSIEGSNDEKGKDYVPCIRIERKDHIRFGEHYYVQRLGKDTCMRCGKQTVFNPEDLEYEKFDNTQVSELFDGIKERIGLDQTYENYSLPNEAIDVQEYLSNMVNIGKNILFLEKKISEWVIYRNSNARYATDYRLKHSNNFKNEIEEQQALIITRVENVKKKIEKFLYVSEDEQQQLEKCNGINRPQIPTQPISPEKPICPIKPTITEPEPMLLVSPVEPVYEKSGFFNKKKVEIENNRKRTEYEEKLKLYTNAIALCENNKKILEEYNDSFAEYQNLMLEYEEKYKVFQAQLRQYEIDMIEYNMASAEYENKLKIIIEKEIERRKNHDMSQIYQVYENAMNDLRDFERRKDLGEIYDVFLATDETYASYRMKELFCQKEIDEAVIALEEQNKCLKQYYDLGFIFSKYHNIVALTTIYEYFVTGRCTSLGGGDGAYNLYENETRANIIINKLDLIINQLEAIKDNQYTLYEVLVDIEKGIGKLNQKMNAIWEEVKDIKVNQDISNGILGSVAVSAAYTAYNTAKIAKYSEMTAKTQKALLFLTAIK